MKVKATRSDALLFEAAWQLGLQPEWASPYGLFWIHTARGRQLIFYSQSPLNTQYGTYLARNKHATRLALSTANLPNIPYALPQSPSELRQFFDQYKPIVLKPTLGFGSQDITVVRSAAQLDSVKYRDKICEQFISGQETRYIVLKGKVIAAQLRTPQTDINTPTSSQRTNLDLSQCDTLHCTLATKTARTLGLTYAGVDLIVDDTGAVHVLEVNTAPGLHFFAHPHAGPPYNLANRYLQAVADFNKV